MKWPETIYAFGLLLGFVIALSGCNPNNDASPKDVLVRVGRVILDPNTASPVVVLEEIKGQRSLWIWIGFAEARSIRAELDQKRPTRPNSHDLAKRLVEKLNGSVKRAVVSELREGTYYAALELSSEGNSIQVDSRPSDAIAIALRTGAPLFVRDRLLKANPQTRTRGTEEQEV